MYWLYGNVNIVYQGTLNSANFWSPNYYLEFKLKQYEQTHKVHSCLENYEQAFSTAVDFVAVW